MKSGKTVLMIYLWRYSMEVSRNGKVVLDIQQDPIERISEEWWKRVLVAIF